MVNDVMIPFWSSGNGGIHVTAIDCELMMLVDIFCGGLAGARKRWKQG